ncbi:solute carrier family 35 member F4-like isoform 1-T1 [Rhinophrynus dorsalis]
MTTLTAKISPETPSATPTPSEITDTDYHTSFFWFSTARFLLGAIISSSLWGCGSHTASIVVQSGVDAIFLAWLCGTASVLSLLLCCGKVCGDGVQSFRFKTLGPHSLTPLVVIKRILPLCSFSLLTLFLYFLALQYLRTSDVAALFSCNKALCYLLSWTVLREQFIGARVIAVICCMAGAVMISYTESFEGEAAIGQILALSAAAVEAVNQVLYQLLIGRINWQDTSIFLGVSGICNILLLWWIPLTFYFQHGIQETEKEISQPLAFLCLTAVLFFLFQFLEKVGDAFLHRSGVTFGIFLSMAVTSALDQRWVLPAKGNLLGISAICMGFLLLLIPDNWEELLGLVPREQGHMEDTSEESRGKGSVLII